MSDRAALPAAVLLPLLLVGLWLVWALSPVPAAPSEVVRALDAVVDRTQPRVVVLGNSSTRMAIDADALASALGAPGRVALLTVDGFASAGWTALLRHRVADRGARPAWVIVAATPDFVLRAASPEPLTRARLAEHLTPDDADLVAKLGGGSTGAAERWRQRRVALRDQVLGVARTAAGLPFVGPDLRAARGEVDLALLGVYGGLGARDPSVAGLLPTLPEPPDVPVGWATSAMPELLATTRALGARLVVVRLPVRGEEDAAEAAQLRAHVEAEATWVDLSAVPLPPDAWEDDAHLGPVGRAALGPPLAAALRAAGVAP